MEIWWNAASSFSSSAMISVSFAETAPRRVLSPARLVRDASKPSGCSATENETVDGSSTGLANSTDTAYESGSRACSAANMRACVHMPWMIGRGDPNSRDVSGDRWIGFASPATPA